MITLGEWLPDQPDTQNAGVTVAKNVIPAAQGYRSMNSFIAYSEAATAKIKGVFAAKDADGNASCLLAMRANYTCIIQALTR